MLRSERGDSALIVHGYNLYHSDWEHVMWGDMDQGLWGRIPLAIHLIVHYVPSIIVWTSGSSEKDGVIESEYIFQNMLDRFEYFFKQTSNQIKNSQKHESIIEHVLRVSVRDTESMNTRESIVKALDWFLDDNNRPIIDQVMQVSSANHIARVLRHSSHEWNEERRLGLIIAGFPALTSYGGGSAEEVEIVELSEGWQYNVERISGLR